MPFSTNERNTLVLTSVGHFGAHFAMLVFPTTAVFLASAEGLALEEVLGWSFAGYCLFGFGAIPVGLLCDRVSALPVVRFGVVAIGLVTLMVGFAPAGGGVMASLAVVGAVASLYHPAGLGLISRGIRSRGTAMGINGVFGNLGIALAPMSAYFLASHFGWRAAYQGIGLFLLVLGCCAALLPIDEPRAGCAVGEGHSTSGRERRVLFSILMVGMALGGLSYRGSTVAQPAFFAERVASLNFGTATTAVYLAGTVGQLVAGVLADRFDLRRLYLGFHLASLPFVALMVGLSDLPLVAAGAAFVFFSLGMQPIENSLVARFTPERLRSTGYGLKFAAVFGLGSFAVFAIEGAVEAGELSRVFEGLTVVVVGIVLVASLLAWRTRGQSLRNTG